MAQHDYNIANADGATVRADLNNALLAVVSLNSGASAPSTTFAYQWWADTTNNLLKQRNAADSAWLIRGPLAIAGVLAKTGAYTVALGDFGKMIDADASGGDFTITLPAAATAGDGFTVAIKNTGSSGTVTIDGNGAETIDGATTRALSVQYGGVILRCDGSAWHVVAEKAAKVLQSISKVVAAQSGTTAFPNDDTTPLVSEGTEIWTQDITPGSSSNKVRISGAINTSNNSGAAKSVAAVFRGSTCIGVFIAPIDVPVPIDLEDSPASGSSVTYSIRFGSHSGSSTWYVGQQSTARYNGELAKNAVTLEDIAA